MKKSLFFLSTLCALSLGVVAFSNNTVSVDATSSGWDEVGATTTDITGGANIIGSAWGARAHTKAMYVLDGLEFDFEFANIADNHSAGFYFGTTHYYYAPQTGATDNALTFYFNASGYSSYNQCRFGIFNTHDWSIGNVTQSYTSTSLSVADGFGYSDGTCVMNKKESHKFHFEFSKVDDTWYKMKMTELTSGSMWTAATYNKNYNNGSTYVFVKASQIALNDKGETYIYAFGFNNSSMNITGVENNYQAVLSFCNTYLFKNTVPTSDVSDTGACLTAYPTAKTEFNKLTTAQKNMFLTDARFADMVARFQAWAIRNGEVFGNDGTISSSPSILPISNTNTSSYAVIAICSVSFVALLLLVIKKRKHISK